MSKHVIVGAGPIGIATAALLAERGDEVILVSRRHATTNVIGVHHIQADASNAVALNQIARGAAVLYNCASPAYNRWVRDWPPLATAMLDAAQRLGAVLATVSNLYGYGLVTAPMTELTPLQANSVKGRVRAQVWRDALALHEAGQIRATEIRSSDYIGPGAQSPLGTRVVPRLLAGKSVAVLNNADTLHSWTYTLDVARMLVTAGGDERAWGHPWHVPTNPPRTQREAINDLAQVAHVASVKVRQTSTAALRLASLFNPVARELPEVAYQFNRPFVMDSITAEHTFGLRPTPWQHVLAATIASYTPRPLPVTV